MREVCFCGWDGEMVDKPVVHRPDGSRALRCPRCGHIDELAWLSPAGVGALLGAAHERQMLRALIGEVLG